MSDNAAPAVGQDAPDFTLKNQKGEEVTLSSFRGEKNVVVVFYPFAFSGICTGELCEIRDDLGRFESEQVTTVAISRIESRSVSRPVISRSIQTSRPSLPLPVPIARACRKLAAS